MFTAKNLVLFVFFPVLAMLILGWSVYRDIHIEREYPGDLANRVVGARLQMDGKSPYFYHWKPQDGLRYYDRNNTSDTLKISNVTATPFFHQLLYPLANLPLRTISRIWLVIDYGALVISMLIALSMASGTRQKLAVAGISLFFLYSYAWTTLIARGQYYILIPLCFMIFYRAISGAQKDRNAVLAGAAAMVLVLIRPNAVLFLLPFLMLVLRYPWRYKILLVSAAAVILVTAFAGQASRFYWSQYLVAMKEHVKLHQDLGPATQHNGPVPDLEQWDGWNLSAIREAQSFPYFTDNGENGNVFVFVKQVLHAKIPVAVLSAACFAFMAVVVFLFYLRYRSTWPEIAPFAIALLGMLLYMASDLFSPVHRFHYNGAPWLFALLLIAARYRRTMPAVYITGVLAGLLLNCLTIRLFPMQHSIGEYLIFASLLGLLLVPRSSETI